MSGALTPRFVAAALLVLALAPARAASQQSSWVPDLGNGKYKNPVLFADYSDPDVIRVGDDFWLVSSSFNSAPGLPILHSRDLVNWRIVNHALPALVPAEHFSVPRYGGGVWAPSIRFHGGKYWIFYPDPDFGIYLITATNPAGTWSAPVLVMPGKGLIDPCPLWDDNGDLYLVHAWARSRAGKNNILTLVRLASDGTHTLGEGRTIIDGNQIADMRTLEGPKFYKRNGWYYIFAPIGGVTQGVQAVFRAKSIEGPYDYRVVLAQGGTYINGPHQGALVDTANGEWWFLHFQDRGAYGRVVHLEPVTWRDDWPLIGAEPDAHGTGQPVLTYTKPAVSHESPVQAPQTSDEFTDAALGLQWQWQANPQPQWASVKARRGWLRLQVVPAPIAQGLEAAPNLLLQKFPAPSFVATTALDFAPARDGDETGLVVFGESYAWIGLRRDANRLVLIQATNTDAAKQGGEHEVASVALKTGKVFLRVTVNSEAKCHFSYSIDGRTFTALGEEFMAVPGRWVGAKVGVFALAAPGLASSASGHADFDWFRVQPEASGIAKTTH